MAIEPNAAAAAAAAAAASAAIESGGNWEHLAGNSGRAA